MYSIEIEVITQIDAAQLSLLGDLCAQIPEFDSPRSHEEYSERLPPRRSLLLLAKIQGEPAGFKLGYALDDNTFYSWLGGVLPDFRQLGLGKALLTCQEDWARTRGYRNIQVKSRNRFPAMLCMLLSQQYRVTSLQTDARDTLDNRLTLNKNI
ncbi:GNAT family N-acetyltransferase [Shewanella salipaludis]|uniref:GNAT family N-acetyltransferase n=1 Tax=Shewanella salipaludis TaxID=2723052 RepID=A0A972FV45_9GAMM|nr:GNAT family N-acetyltransferase [Shewanella salipaludis]NMH66685.1 GNAT family N-acetyltransferase [Shewanella salipaludis]